MPVEEGTGSPEPDIAIVQESQSMIGTTIAQVIGFIRMIAEKVMNWMTRLIQWAGENPLAASTLFMNLLIWFS